MAAGGLGQSTPDPLSLREGGVEAVLVYVVLGLFCHSQHAKQEGQKPSLEIRGNSSFFRIAQNKLSKETIPALIESSSSSSMEVRFYMVIH